jgi:hypothetical protein
MYDLYYMYSFFFYFPSGKASSLHLFFQEKLIYNLLKFIVMSAKLKFKEETNVNGRVSKVANFNGTLSRLSEQEFSYENANGETVEYRLATVAMTDSVGEKHNLDGVVVYKTAIEKGMTVGKTYLGRVQIPINADGSAGKPWVTLSSAEVATQANAMSFEDIASVGEIANIGE